MAQYNLRTANLVSSGSELSPVIVLSIPLFHFSEDHTILDDDSVIDGFSCSGSMADIITFKIRLHLKDKTLAETFHIIETAGVAISGKIFVSFSIHRHI